MKPMDILLEFNDAPNTDVSSFRADLAGFSLKKVLLPHIRFKQAISRIAQLHHYSLHNEVGGGLLITGASGFGKSTIVEYYVSMFARKEEAQNTRIPVLLITTPTSPTVRSFSEAILLALKDPLARRGSAEEKTFRIYQLLKSCEVELLLIDEFQHFYYAHSIVEFRRITDWLKNLISITGLAVVLSGLPESELVIRSNEQLDRRFSSRMKLPAFRIENDGDFAEFRGVLKAFQEALPLPVETPLYEANLARRFIVASGGLLDYARKTLEGAVTVAAEAGYQSLDMAAYAAGFRKEIWEDVGDRLNPFHPESPLRALNRPGEPFYDGDKRHAIGSPLARRLISKSVERY